MTRTDPGRRDFLGTSLRAGAALAALGPLGLGSDLGPRHPLNILILGGTSFLGPHQIAYALGRGHSISIFTRGRTEPTVHQRLFNDVEHLIGDREGDLSALRGRSWDAVIDNSGRQVEWATEAAELLRDRVDLYLYTSSTGVYYPYLGADITEDTEVVLDVPAGIDEEQFAEYDYGVMKARSELEVRRVFGEARTIVVRPTYIMGPADRTDRFTYWPVRLSLGGEVLVPGRPDDPVQYIDVRDVSHWMIRLIESRTAGTFNAVGPASTTGVQAFVHGAHAAFSTAAEFTSVPDYAFLSEHGVNYAIPWIPPLGNNFGTARASLSRAVANGLTFTPLAESVRDIQEWWHSGVVPEERRVRMETDARSLMAREPQILAAWRAQSSPSPSRRE
jgi:2'-hydroxyisoflavone reductase